MKSLFKPFTKIFIFVFESTLSLKSKTVSGQKWPLNLSLSDKLALLLVTSFYSRSSKFF